MVFCGQCGYQLRSGDAACPRCGMVTEPMITLDDSDADSPTITSNSMNPASDAETYVVATQQPGQPISYPSFTPPGGPHTDFSQPGLYDTPVQLASQPRRRTRTLVVVCLTLIVLVAGAASVVYLLYFNTPTLTPSQQAQALLQRFYDDINTHAYQDAYNQLGQSYQQQQSYSSFASGYTHTRHDSITFNSISPQNNGTVIVSMTIQATEDATSGTGTQLSTYQGNYTVGMVNGSWKILSGAFTKVA